MRHHNVVIAVCRCMQISSEKYIDDVSLIVFVIKDMLPLRLLLYVIFSRNMSKSTVLVTSTVTGVLISLCWVNLKGIPGTTVIFYL